MTMAFESTVTEFEMDAGAQQFIQRLRSENGHLEPDLKVDGLTDGLFWRLLGLFRFGRN
jgi:hypothetical protein